MDSAAEGGAAALTGQIIDRFGGIRPMATKLDTPVTTVQGWKKRGAIPAARHADILAAAAREGVALEPEELAQTDPGGAARPDPRTQESEGDKSAANPRAARDGGAGAALTVSVLALAVAASAAAAGWALYLRPLQKHVAELETRVAAAEPGGALAKRIDALEAQAAQRPAPATAASGEGGDRLAVLEQQMADIKSGAARIDDLAKRLSDLQIAAGGRELLAQSIRDIQASTAATQGEVERLDTQMKATGQRLDQVDAVLSQRRQQALRAEAVVLAVGQLRAALKTSKPFAKELAAVRAITADDKEMAATLDQLQPLAESGVPSEDDLHSDFDRLAPDIVRSAVVGDGSSWWRQTLYRVESVISIRRTGSGVQGDRTDAVVARADAKLDEDDLKGAADTLRALAGLPADVAAPWLHDADQRLAADAAETELTRLAIDRVATGADRTAPAAAAITPPAAAATQPPAASQPQDRAP